jgi:hypothetical protein
MGLITKETKRTFEIITQTFSIVHFVFSVNGEREEEFYCTALVKTYLAEAGTYNLYKLRKKFF